MRHQPSPKTGVAYDNLTPLRRRMMIEDINSRNAHRLLQPI